MTPKPNEKYFAHVDWVIKKAEEKGIFIGCCQPGVINGIKNGELARRFLRLKMPELMGNFLATVIKTTQISFGFWEATVRLKQICKDKSSPKWP